MSKGERIILIPMNSDNDVLHIHMNAVQFSKFLGYEEGYISKKIANGRPIKIKEKRYYVDYEL